MLENGNPRNFCASKIWRYTVIIYIRVPARIYTRAFRHPVVAYAWLREASLSVTKLRPPHASADRKFLSRFADMPIIERSEYNNSRVLEETACRQILIKTSHGGLSALACGGRSFDVAFNYALHTLLF